MTTITERQVNGGRIRIVSKQEGEQYAQFSYLLNNVIEEDKVELDKMCEQKIDEFIAKKRNA